MRTHKNAFLRLLLLSCLFCAQSRASALPSSTYCDSLNTAVTIYNSQYAGDGTMSRFAYVMDLEFGFTHYDSIVQQQVSSDGAYWFAQISACGISYPSILNCTLAQGIMNNFYAQYPQWSSHCSNWVWTEFLTANGAANGNSNSVQEWRLMLSTCGIGYPAADTPHNLCDSLSSALTAYNFAYPGGSDFNTFVYTLNGYLGWQHYDTAAAGMAGNDLAYWHSTTASCGLASPTFINCGIASTAMGQFYSAYPQYQASSPGFLWAQALNQSGAAPNGQQYSDKDWKTLLTLCSISYPSPDTLATYCDSLTAARIAYQSLSSTQHTPSSFVNLMSNMMGIGTYYSSATSQWQNVDVTYWQQSLSSCGLSCASIANGPTMDSLMDVFRAQNPQYAVHAPAIAWVSFMNLNKAAGDNTQYSLQDWMAILGCYGVSYPAIDSTPFYCDSLQAVLTVYNSSSIPRGDVWSFVSFMNTCMNDYAHPDSLNNWQGNNVQYWYRLSQTCGLSCPRVVSCSLADSIMNDFNNTFPQNATHSSPFTWASYLNDKGAGTGWYLSPVDWTTILNCCGMQVPSADTNVHSFCDSLQATMNLYNQEYPNGTYLGNVKYFIASFLGWTRYDSAAGRIINTTDGNYWYDKLNHCGISLPYAVDCSTVESLMSSFKAAYPQDSLHCYPIFWASYLNNNQAGEDGNGESWSYTPGDWMVLLNNCNIPYPSPDTLYTHCDSISIIATVDSNGTPFIDPTYDLDNLFGYQHFDSASNGYIDNDAAYWFSQIKSCGLCSRFTNCDTLTAVMDTFYSRYPQYATHCPPFVLAAYLDGHINRQGIDDNTWPAMLSCCNITVPTADTVFTSCDSNFMYQSAISSYQLYFSSCLPEWLDNVLLQQYGVTYAQVCQQASTCGFQCPAVCSMPLVFHCDSINSVSYVYQLFQSQLQSHPAQGDGDNNPGLSDVYGALYGSYSPTYSIIPQIITCDTSSCLMVSYPLAAVSPIFNTYSGCLPSKVFTAGMNMYSGIQRSYSDWCTLFSHCGDTCPVVCDSVYSSCDSVHEATDLMGRMMANAGSNDTASWAVAVFSAYFGRNLSAQNVITMQAMCTPGLCDLFVVGVTSGNTVNVNICAGDTSALIIPGGISYAWSTGDTSSGISVTTAGSYTVTVASSSGCTATGIRNVIVNTKPTASAGNDTTIVAGQGVIIGANVVASGGSPPYTYLWSPSDNLSSATTSNPIATPAVSASYTIKVTDANGCTGTSVMNFTVIPLYQVECRHTSWGGKF